MKIKLICLLTLMCQFATVHSQTFEVISKTNFAIDAVIDPNDIYRDFKVNSLIKNAPNSGDVTYIWEGIVTTPYPKEWVITVCDPELCNIFTNTPTSAFIIKASNTKPIFDVGAITQGVPGSVVINMKIYPKGKPELLQTFDYKIKVSSLTGVESYNDASSLLSVFPNPCGDNVSVSTALLSGQEFQISAYDVLGNKVKSFGQYAVSGVIDLGVSDLCLGTYFINITNIEGKSYNKLFIKR